MKPIQQFLVFLLFLSATVFARAASNPKLTFEPIFGVETSLVRYPEPPRYVSRGTYGARLLYGVTPLSAELEYMEAQSKKDYASTDQKVFDKVQRASLGIRSTFALGSFLGFYLRLGGRATQGTTEVTTAGVTETKDQPLRVDPYAGTGLQLAFSSFLALNAGVTMIHNQENEFDSQYTLGLTARLGKP